MISGVVGVRINLSIYLFSKLSTKYYFLHSSLKKMLFRLEVPLSSVYEKLQNVLAKFNLTNKNLHLRPHEASLMCLCLLHLLADDDTLYPHDRLVEMVATFNSVSDNAEGFLASISELAHRLREESLNSPS